MEDNNEKIRKKVLKLIELNKEGTYWDFKQAHYKNNVNLLKDILSLANCKHFGDRYLIIGVCENDDGQNKFKVKGLDNDKNRKDQAKIVNFLSSLQFAGENIPNIEVTSIIIPNINGELKEVDVIIIKNHALKPYFLLKDYYNNKNGIKHYEIWTRNKDTNSLAKYEEIKEMWREQLGLNNDIIIKFKNALVDYKNWEINFDNRHSYYKFNSNFKLEIEDYLKKDSIEAFNTFYLNNELYLSKIKFMNHETEIYSCKFISCDGFRVEFPIPNFCLIKENHEKLFGFYYYNLETFEGLLANLLLKKGFFESRTSSFPFIMFKNFDEQNDFKNYLIQNNFDLNIYEQIHQHNTTDPICYKKFIDLNSLSIYKEIYENKYQSYLKENFKK